MEGSTFSKLMEMEVVLKILQEKGGGNAKWGDLSRNGGLPYYTEVFLEIPHDAA